MIDKNVGAGSTLISGSTLRRLIGGSNVAITEDADGNLVLTAAGGGSSGIPSTIAEFLSTGITLKVPTTFNQGAVCTGTLETDVIKSDSYLAKIALRSNCLDKRKAASPALLTATAFLA